MDDLNLPIFDGVSIIAEPDGNQCRLTIRLSWDALERLLASVAGYIEPEKLAAADRRRKAEESRQEFDQRRAEAVKFGRTLLGEIAVARETGLSRPGALKAVATRHGLSVHLIEIYARLARKADTRRRDERILTAVLSGKTNKQIARREGLSPNSISRIISAARKKGAGTEAGAGSRPFSGDRAGTARRKGLEAVEASQASPQGSREKARSAVTPAPLPAGEARGCGGKAPARRGARATDGEGR